MNAQKIVLLIYLFKNYFFSDENSETDPLVDSLEDKATEGQIQLQAFWPEVMDSIKRITTVEPGNQILPLARIKKIMKLDEDVKMISAEAPLLFAKAAEIFIHELTLRSWLHTEDNKRRTLQRNDIAMAIAKYDQFDFLIDIVPREEMKPVKKEYDTKNNVILNGGIGVSSGVSGTTTNNDQVQYYLQLAQQHQQALQGQSPASVVTQLQQTQPTIQVASPGTMVAAAPTQNILVTNPATSQTQSIGLNNLQAQTNNNNQIQLVQQLISNTGEVTQIPVNYNLLRNTNIIRILIYYFHF